VEDQVIGQQYMRKMTAKPAKILPFVVRASVKPTVFTTLRPGAFSETGVIRLNKEIFQKNLRSS